MFSASQTSYIVALRAYILQFWRSSQQLSYDIMQKMKEVVLAPFQQIQFVGA